MSEDVTNYNDYENKFLNEHLDTLDNMILELFSLFYIFKSSYLADYEGWIENLLIELKTYYQESKT